MVGRRKIRLPRSGFVHLSRPAGYHPPQKPEICLTDRIGVMVLAFQLLWRHL